MLQTKELLVLKSNVSNITFPAATMATAASAATTATIATAASAATIATTTSSLKTTSTTSVLVALVLMNSTISNTTKLQSPVAQTINTLPNCYRQQIECPWTSVRDVKADKHTSANTQMVKDYVSSSVTPLKLITTRAKLSAVVDVSHSSDFGHSSNFNPTTALFNENQNGTGWTESTTEMTFKTVGDLQITAEVFYDETPSSENTTTTAESDVSYTHNYDEMMDNSTVGLATAESITENSTRDLFTAGSTITNSMDVSFDFSSTTPGSISSSTETVIGETIPSKSTVGSMMSVITESTESLDAVIVTANTTYDQSIISIDDDDELYSTISSEDLQFWPTDEKKIASAEERRIVKRMSEVIFNGTHCFQIVCSPPSPVTKYVTEVPNDFQGFSEKSSKYQRVYSYT